MLLALVSTALILLFPSPAHTEASPALFGFNDNSTVAGDLSPKADAQFLAGAGANSARITVDWSWVARKRGRLDLSRYVPVYRQWLGRGIRPILIVTGAPAGARVGSAACRLGETCHAPPDRAHNRGWAHFVRAVARRFRRAEAIEVWNEPNNGAFFQPRPDPARYAELLRLARRAVKAVAPRQRVLGGSLADDLTDRKTDESWGVRPFLRAMYTDGARGLMSGISIHAYPRKRGDGQIYEAIDTALEIRDDFRDRAPLWLTEVGQSTTGANRTPAGPLPPALGAQLSRAYLEALQAAELGDVIPRLLRRPELAGVYVHSLADPRQAQADDIEDGFGLIRPDGSAKPAYCAVGRARGRQSNCVAPAASQTQVARWDAQERVQAAAEAALARHRARGTYRGLTLPDSAGVDVHEQPGSSDSTQVCDRLLEERTYCITLVHGRPWSFTMTGSSGNTGTW